MWFNVKMEKLSLEPCASQKSPRKKAEGKSKSPVQENYFNLHPHDFHRLKLSNEFTIKNKKQKTPEPLRM